MAFSGRGATEPLRAHFVLFTGVCRSYSSEINVYFVGQNPEDTFSLWICCAQDELTIAHRTSCFSSCSLLARLQPNTAGHCTVKTQGCLFQGNDFIRTPAPLGVSLLPPGGGRWKVCSREETGLIWRSSQSADLHQGSPGRPIWQHFVLMGSNN